MQITYLHVRYSFPLEHPECLLSSIRASDDGHWFGSRQLILLQLHVSLLGRLPICELPFWKGVWVSMWPSAVTASRSNSINAWNATDVSNIIFKKQWQLRHSQITVFSALPYLSVHTCKFTEILTSVFNRAHSFLSNKMSWRDLPYFTSAILPFNLITAKYQVLTILMQCSISCWIRNNETGLNLWFMVNCLN